MEFLILKAFFLPLWHFSRSVRDIFFFLRKVFEVRETGNPEVPL